jgi:hypothetical protein
LLSHSGREKTREWFAAIKFESKPITRPNQPCDIYEGEEVYNKGAEADGSKVATLNIDEGRYCLSFACEGKVSKPQRNETQSPITLLNLN